MASDGDVTDLVSSRRLCILGGGGLAAEVLALIDLGVLAGYSVRGFVAPDRDSSVLSRLNPELTWLGTDEIASRAYTDDQVFPGIGSPQVKQRLAHGHWKGRLLDSSLIHPSSEVSTRATWGVATLVLGLSSIGVAASLGKAVLIDRHVAVGHGTRIGDFCSIYQGAIISGDVDIGAAAAIGAGAVILPGVRVGRGVLVGAGSVVTKSVPPGTTVIGVPARPISSDRG